MFYDIAFLVIFTLLVALFLYKRRRNLKREGLLYLYRTKVGMKIIEWTTKRYPRLLKKLEYVVIASGYLLMFFGIWFIVKVAYTYITSPYIAQALKVPVIMPLIPYLPELFKIDFLPPFYFTYWILIIAILAIPHEFAHGIFARLNKIRILSTGFGFLGPFLAAFVEQDDKQMQKSSKFAQLSILAAGTFANVLVTIFFGIILLLFFAATFSPAGVNFSMYSISAVNSSSISAIGPNYLDNSTLVEIKANNKTYFADEQMLNESLANKEEMLVMFDDSPALNAKLDGAIAEIDGKKITSYTELNSSLASYKPGDKITITTIGKGDVRKDYKITLAEKDGRAFLGIGIVPQTRSGMFSWLSSLIMKVKSPFVYYESKMGDFGVFILDLLWWIVMINISVALVNMLPLGIFDGGRFLYLTVWGITGRKKVGEWAFKISTWLLLGIIALMLVKWLFIFV
jgi:membrane-associated protease RseP (regulator of RpoE activity)